MKQFLGMITQYAGNRAPNDGWALCDGQQLEIMQHQALFSILGTTYGGDGRRFFKLPDFRGRTAIHAGHGAGLTPRRIGQRGGIDQFKMTIGQMPPHNHRALTAHLKINTTSTDTSNSPKNYAAPSYGNDGTSNFDVKLYGYSGDEYGADDGVVVTVGNAGAPPASQQPIDNMQPFQCVSWVIAIQGNYPSRR